MRCKSRSRLSVKKKKKYFFYVFSFDICHVPTTASALGSRHRRSIDGVHVHAMKQGRGKRITSCSTKIKMGLLKTFHPLFVLTPDSAPPTISKIHLACYHISWKSTNGQKVIFWEEFRVGGVGVGVGGAAAPAAAWEQVESMTTWVFWVNTLFFSFFFFNQVLSWS